jgi:demethylspheroidene O-methyltransferase
VSGTGEGARAIKSDQERQDPTWRQRLDARIDGWLTSQGLYRWALGNPVGRWITRRRANALFGLMSGFVHSQVLLACVRLGLFERVLAQPSTLAELSRQTGINKDALQRLLDSALSLQLLEMREGQRYGLGPLGAPVAAHAGLRDMIEHNAVLYQDLRDPLALLHNPEGAGMQAYWPYPTDIPAREPAQARPSGPAKPVSPAHRAEDPRPEQDSQSARYSALMSSSQKFLIEELLAVYPFGRHRCVLDVGGGQGGWVCELARREPALSLMLFDLPPVAALARQRIEQAGLTDRITAYGGSFTADPLPQGADLVTLLRVAHDHSDEVVRGLLQAIYRALPVGGSLLLAEPMAQPGGRPALSDPYFHFYLLAMGAGRLRTASELGALMQAAGFSKVKALPNPMPLHASLLLGQKR